MCGIVGGIAERNVAPILLDGLKKLEYRGYDSAGIAMITEPQQMERFRLVGKVEALQALYLQQPLPGKIGIGHTRWATHGKPTLANAHPLYSKDQIAIVHNGIIENYAELKQRLKDQGYEFHSETDTEVIAHLLYSFWQQTGDMLSAIAAAKKELMGAYVLGIINKNIPDRLYAVCKSGPLVIGLGEGENYISSDPLALLPVTQRFIYLEEGDTAEISLNKINIFNLHGQVVQRKAEELKISAEVNSKGKFHHFMLKEIHEQPEMVKTTLNEYLVEGKLPANWLGAQAAKILPQVKRIHIVACGTSYHAGLVARYWLEEYLQIPCLVEVASEYRYRRPVVETDTLFVALSQSGETADTLAALRKAKQENFLGQLAICNVPQSSLVRESDIALLMHAGPEIGVAATKTFTAQLLALFLLTYQLSLYKKSDPRLEEAFLALPQLSQHIQWLLNLEPSIQYFARCLADKQKALFLGRGVVFPIALEGALKLKEISYLFVEAYPAGELKHGALALIDDGFPVIVLAPYSPISEKLISNIHEVQARGGVVYSFADERLGTLSEKQITLPAVNELFAPLIYIIPLQLLAYHTAVLKGADVDQPRNLAKSVTVE